MRLRYAFITVAALALTACATMSGPAPLKATDFASILADPRRPAADLKDDAARKPAEIMEFAQLRPGDTVLELEVGRGWFTEIISRAVGPTGKVITQNPAEFAYSGPAMKARRDAGGLANVSDTTSRFDDLKVPDASVDKVVWILGPHEIYFRPNNSPGLGDEAKTYAEIKRVLKPGGTFIAMDHAANAGAPRTVAQTTHRVDPAIVMTAAQTAGFKLEAKSDIMANPADDRTKGVFDATIRRHTDQFLYRFKKAK